MSDQPGTARATPDTPAPAVPSRVVGTRHLTVGEDTRPLPSESTVKVEARARSAPLRRLGAGLVVVPWGAEVDPRSVIEPAPVVDEALRFCWQCREAVGRTRSGHVESVVGDCPKCKAHFDFRPILQTGELVTGQYEIQGCLAHGGLGWIYLAIDRNVSDRWVVLKGLQNPMDFEAQVVALAERQFLSEVVHRNIVKIHNFVKHRSAAGVVGSYIVMEYIGGRSLKWLLDHQTQDRLPVAEAIAYIMEILSALDYLHSLGLAYNDLKPDNIMIGSDEVKLIDLGGVSPIGSYGSVYGTPGYLAPEILRTGPSVASDIYTAGRTLAALTISMPRDKHGHYEHGLPAPEDEPRFRRYPAFERLLSRATDPDPDERFGSAREMNTQLAGVLRSVLATDSGHECPQPSAVFGSPRGDFGTETLLDRTDEMVDGVRRESMHDVRDVVAALPVPLIDGDDPSAELLSPLLHTDPNHTLDALRRSRERMSAGTIATPATFEVEGTLATARAFLDLGLVEPVRTQLRTLERRFGSDWRIDWYQGIAGLLRAEPVLAYRHFDQAWTKTPGEIAPVLALAAAAEVAAQHAEGEGRDRWRRAATEHYRLAWQTNHGLVSAAFGLARRLAEDGDRLAATAVLDQVERSSRHFGSARMTGCLLLVSCPPDQLTAAELFDAADRIENLDDDPRAPQLRILVLWAALAWLLTAHTEEFAHDLILGYRMTEASLRQGLESNLRVLARRSPRQLHRYRLVDLANYIRPRTVF